MLIFVVDYSSPRQKMQTQKSTSRWEQPHPPQKKKKATLPANSMTSQPPRLLSNSPLFQHQPLISFKRAFFTRTSISIGHLHIFLNSSLVVNISGTVKISLVIYFANTPPSSQYFVFLISKKKEKTFCFRFAILFLFFVICVVIILVSIQYVFCVDAIFVFFGLYLLFAFSFAFVANLICLLAIKHAITSLSFWGVCMCRCGPS